MRTRYILATLVAFGLSQPALADKHMDAQHAQHAAEMSEGTIKKIDLAKGRVTIAHGPLKSLNMPAMTMVFRAAKPELLQGLTAGDKVRFDAADQDGKMVVTVIEKAK